MKYRIRESKDLITFLQVLDTHGDGEDVSDRKVSNDKLHVEQTRRVHQNDIEIIYAFIFISSLYLITVKPRNFIAKCLFIGFTFSRFTHTFANLYEVNRNLKILYFSI